MLRLGRGRPEAKNPLHRSYFDAAAASFDVSVLPNRNRLGGIRPNGAIDNASLSVMQPSGNASQPAWARRGKHVHPLVGSSRLSIGLSKAYLPSRSAKPVLSRARKATCFTRRRRRGNQLGAGQARRGGVGAGRSRQALPESPGCPVQASPIGLVRKGKPCTTSRSRVAATAPRQANAPPTIAESAIFRDRQDI